ncbi:MAG: hypothetical protein WB508_07255 [Aeromicrobium sp.]|uniref:hypothetical protein n=1 Tax=Aeromicrobium sp. TaxID=1871063 RepID=UPI003C384E25
MTNAPSRRTVPPIAWTLGVLGLVLAIAGGVLFALPARGGAQTDSADSKKVVARVTDFAVAYNTYDVADPKEYQDRLSGLLTTEYQAEVVKITDALFTAIKDKKQKSGSAQVLAVAIDSMDDDSAVVLAVVDAKVTNTDNDAAVLRQFRWSIDVKKVKGEWRVSKFESVAAQPADAGQDDGATPDPESPTPATPSAEVTP